MFGGKIMSLGEGLRCLSVQLYTCSWRHRNSQEHHTRRVRFKVIWDLHIVLWIQNLPVLESCRVSPWEKL